MLVSANTFQPLQHFISFERDAALCGVRTRKNRAPNGMSVQDRPGMSAANDGKMKQGFRGRPAIAAYHVSSFIHLQELPGREAALVQARRSNRQAQRLAGNYRAEVSARSHNPSAIVKTS